jgi:hypothetical protein
MRQALRAVGAWVRDRQRRAATDLVLIVRRGMSAEYYKFCSMLATTNRVPVLMDRRVGERRQRSEAFWGADRRSGDDRRSRAPKSWTDSQFALARIATEGAALLAPDDLPEIGNNGLELPSGRQTTHL